MSDFRILISSCYKKEGAFERVWSILRSLGSSIECEVFLGVADIWLICIFISSHVSKNARDDSLRNQLIDFFTQIGVVFDDSSSFSIFESDKTMFKSVLGQLPKFIESSRTIIESHEFESILFLQEIISVDCTENVSLDLIRKFDESLTALYSIFSVAQARCGSTCKDFYSCIIEALGLDGVLFEFVFDVKDYKLMLFEHEFKHIVAWHFLTSRKDMMPTRRWAFDYFYNRTSEFNPGWCLKSSASNYDFLRELNDAKELKLFSNQQEVVGENVFYTASFDHIRMLLNKVLYFESILFSPRKVRNKEIINEKFFKFFFAFVSDVKLIFPNFFDFLFERWKICGNLRDFTLNYMSFAAVILFTLQKNSNSPNRDFFASNDSLVFENNLFLKMSWKAIFCEDKKLYDIVSLSFKTLLDETFLLSKIVCNEGGFVQYSMEHMFFSSIDCNLFFHEFSSHTHHEVFCNLLMCFANAQIGFKEDVNERLLELCQLFRDYVCLGVRKSGLELYNIAFNFKKIWNVCKDDRCLIESIFLFIGFEQEYIDWIFLETKKKLRNQDLFVYCDEIFLFEEIIAAGIFGNCEAFGRGRFHTFIVFWDVNILAHRELESLKNKINEDYEYVSSRGWKFNWHAELNNFVCLLYDERYLDKSSIRYAVLVNTFCLMVNKKPCFVWHEEGKYFDKAEIFRSFFSISTSRDLFTHIVHSMFLPPFLGDTDIVPFDFLRVLKYGLFFGLKFSKCLVPRGLADEFRFACNPCGHLEKNSNLPAFRDSLNFAVEEAIRILYETKTEEFLHVFLTLLSFNPDQIQVLTLATSKSLPFFHTKFFEYAENRGVICPDVIDLLRKSEHEVYYFSYNDPQASMNNNSKSSFKV